MDNSKRLVEKIREKNLKPLPRWWYSVKNAVAWLFFLFAMVFGALAFSVILFSVQQIDHDLLSHMSHSLIELLLGLVPLFWIISLVIFLSVSIIGIKKSKKGYKLTLLSMIGYCTATSILFGTLFFISGGAKWLENAFDSKISLYESLQDRKTKHWTLPEEGFLSGTIQSADDTAFVITDFLARQWTIDYKDADIVPSVKINAGETVKITGKMISYNRFNADKICPWGGTGQINNSNR